MKIRMLETKPGSPDGINAQEYVNGKVYDLPIHSSLGNTFIAAGWAEEMRPGPSETKPARPTETKPGRAKRRKKAKA